MNDIQIIPESELLPLPESAFTSGGRVRPEFFFSSALTAGRLRNFHNFPRKWLPYCVFLSTAWWDDNWSEAEEWLNENARAPWMLWMTNADGPIVGTSTTKFAIFFRNVNDAVHFKLAMPA